MTTLRKLVLTIFLATVLALPGWANSSTNAETVAGEIRAQAEDLLAGMMPDGISEWHITDFQAPTANRIPEKFDYLQVTSRETTVRSNRVYMDVEFYENNNIISKLSARAQIEAYAELVVPEHDIQRGDLLTGQGLRLERSRVNLPADSFCTDIANVVGQAAQRRLVASRAIRNTDIAPPPDIRAGEEVMIVAENGIVRVTTKGIAKADGLVGEMIPVVNLRSNKKINARVMSASSVLVGF